jgi:hypothetical protein
VNSFADTLAARAAVHEARHAVVGRVVDFDLIRVEVGDNGTGFTTFADMPPDRLRDWATRALAGGAAERRFFDGDPAGEAQDQQDVVARLGDAAAIDPPDDPRPATSPSPPRSDRRRGRHAVAAAHTYRRRRRGGVSTRKVKL